MKTLALLYPGCIEFEIMLACEILNPLYRQLKAHGAFFGAICAGPVILDQARLLDGHRIAHGYGEPQIAYLKESGFFANTVLSNAAVAVTDGIVTAKPNSFIDFAIELAVLTGVIPEHRKKFWQEYYWGRES